MRSPATPARSVLITGTSSGFGLVTAVELAKRGWQVFATMRNLEKRGPLDQALKSASVDGAVDFGQLDVTSSQSISAAVARTLAKTGGRLDAVVHNAGVAAGGAFEDLPDSELRRVMETNFFGVLELTRVLLPTFRNQRSGRIVVVSSEFGLRRAACQLDLLRLEMGDRGLGGITRFRGIAVRHRRVAYRAGALHHRHLGQLPAHQPG